jgi:phosphoglucomutase
MEKIKSIMEGYRKNPPKAAGGYEILKCRDYMAATITDSKTGEVAPTGLPKSDVLYYEMNDDAWCAIRPSGTEPKIKFYFGVKGDSKEDASNRLNLLCNDEIFSLDE